MEQVTALPPLVATVLVTGILAVGVSVLVLADRTLAGVVAGTGVSWHTTVSATIGRAALLARQRPTVTERPDLPLWLLAPGFYGACAAVAVAVVPVAAGIAAADVRTGIVVFGAVESSRWSRCTCTAGRPTPTCR